jgi:hypothetical protein
MRAVWLGCLGLACALCAAASDWTSLYGDAVLAHEKPRLQQLVEDVDTNEIGPCFTGSQRLVFGTLRIDLPLSANSSSPIDGDLRRGTAIVLPALTLLFVEDLAKAYAWLWTSRLSSETVDEYISMLRYRKAADFPEGKYPAPAAALHVPANALENPDAKKMFLRLRTSAYMFLILHQMGHLRASPGETEEEQADLFALDLMRRNSETPLGLLLIINAGVYLPDARDPVTAKRLVAMANYLDRRVQDFVDARPDRVAARDAIHAIARDFRVSAGLLDDPGIQMAWAERAKRTDVSTLQPKPQPQPR